MRESRTYGSVRGALSNGRPYRDMSRTIAVANPHLAIAHTGKLAPLSPDPSPRERSEWWGGWLLVSESERGVGWGAFPRVEFVVRPPTPAFASLRPTLPTARKSSRGEGWAPSMCE